MGRVLTRVTLDEVGHRNSEAERGLRGGWVVGVLLLLVILGSGAADGVREGTIIAPEIAVSPSHFEIMIGSRPVTRTLRVVNLGVEPVEFKVGAATWDLDEQNQVRILESTEQTLDRWMLVNPTQFTVVGGGMQVVRFSIVPKLQPDPGEHRAMIYLTESSGAEDRARSVEVRFKMGIAVYAYVPEVVRLGVVHGVHVDASVSPPVASIDFGCTGNSHVRLKGRYSVWPAEAYRRYRSSGHGSETDRPDAEEAQLIVESGDLPAIPVLPGSRRELVFTLKGGSDSGDYVLEIQATIDGSRLDRVAAFTIHE